MWPFNDSTATETRTIGIDDAEYDDDGRMVCPRCGSGMWTLETMTRRRRYHMRFLACNNCGYGARIEDGVVIHK